MKISSGERHTVATKMEIKTYKGVDIFALLTFAPNIQQFSPKQDSYYLET